MKITILLIGILFAVATAIPERPTSDDDENPEMLQQRNYPIRYRPGKTYIYQYNAQILTGVPQTSEQYTGYKLLARVKLAMRAGRRVTMVLDRIQLLQANRIMPVDRPVVLLPRRLFEDIDDTKAVEIMKEKLKLPIGLTWLKNGTVNQIRKHRLDQFWSINMKKAIASMLNINMTIKVQNVFRRNGIWEQTQDYEDGIDGNCKSAYSYTRFPYTIRNGRQTSRNLITIVKNRDLLQCRQWPWMEHALFMSQRCEDVRKPMSAQSETRYNATKANDNFFLRQILTLSQYSYTPESGQNGTITSFVVQRLRFLADSNRIDVKLPESESQKEDLGLMMILPIQEMRIVKQDSEILKKQAKAAVTMMLIEYQRDSIEMYDRMRQVIEITRKMSAGDIKQVVLKALKDPEVSAKNRRMLLELLPKIATKQIITVICELIEDNELPDEESAMLVSRLGGMTFVSHDVMVTKLMKTARQMRSIKQRETYKSLLLTIGQLINTRYNRPVPSQMEPIPHPLLTRALIRQFYQQILSKPSPILERNTKQITVALALGNCRLTDPCLDILEDMIPIGKRIRRSVRVYAIYALAEMAHKAPLRIRRTIMPIYFDLREDVELRLASYMVFIRTKPTRSELKIITKSLIKEKSQQVRSLVLSHLQELSEMADNRCMAGLAQNASRVLDDMKKETFGAQYSHIVGIPVRSLNRAIAGILATPTSFLPRSAALRLVAQAMGVNVELVQLIANADEAQELLQRVLGPDGTLRLAKSVKDLLKPLTGSKKMDADFSGIIKMYESTYSIGGLSKEVTKMLRDGLIPLSQKWYDILTKGGMRKDQLQHTLFADKLSTVATSFGVPFSVNHTITGHLKVSTSLKLQPNLFAKAVGASINITHRGSIRRQLRVGADLTLLTSFVEANSHVHLPKTQNNTIKIAWDKQNAQGENMNTAFRINVNRPQSAATKLLSLSSRLHSVLIRKLALNPIASRMPIRHRSLPAPKKKTNYPVSAESLGLTLRVQTLLLNSTGVVDLANLPFHSPADVKVYLDRDESVGDDRSIDVSGRVKTVVRNIQDIVTKIFNASEEGSLSQAEQDKMVTQEGQIKRWQLLAALRLRNFTMKPVPTLETEGAEVIPAIGQLVIEAARFKTPGTFSLLAKAKKLQRPQWSYGIYGLSRVNEVVQRPQFDKGNPLKMEKTAKMELFANIVVNGRRAIRSKLNGTMGDFWINAIERIVRNDAKKLVNMPDLQTCQKDIERKRPDSPACLQAWKDINAISRAIIDIQVRRDAPEWMKRIPLVVHEAVHRLYGSQLVSSNLTKTQGILWQQQLRLDSQLSPYDQRVTTMWLSAMNILDRYVNARSSLSLKNSITMTPAENIQANIFDGLYPATCQIVSKKRIMSVRTFDGLDMATRAVLTQKVGGRVVLMQDIQKRVLVSEQRSINHRVTQIRLREKANHVLVAVNEKIWPNIPTVIYRGKPQKLPFVLRNKDDQVVLRAINQPTERSPHSITVQLPLLGSVVKTHPLVGTEIILDPFFRSNVRGICGDFDGELFDEKKGPKCLNVYRRPIDFMKRYTTILARVPTLKMLETLPAMTSFMKTARCLPGRRYPNLR